MQIVSFTDIIYNSNFFKCIWKHFSFYFGFSRNGW